MDNLFNLLRLRNIFEPQPIGNDLPEQGGFGGNLPRGIGPIKLGMPDYPDREIFKVPEMQASANDSLDSLTRLYHPSTDMSDLYKDTILHMPERNKNVGFGKKLLGVLGSIGGRPDTYDRITQPDYYKDMDTWEARLKAISPVMQTERLANVNERMSINDLIKARLGQEREDRIRDYGTRRLDLQEAKLRLDQWKNEHPDWDIKETKGGNYVMFNPKDPSAKPVDTGIPTGTLSALELENYKSKHIAETGAEARKTEGVRQAGRMSLAEYRAAHPDYKLVTDEDGRVLAVDPKNPNVVVSTGIEKLSDEEKIKLNEESKIRTKAAPGNNTNSTGTLPTQQRVAQFNKAREAYNSKPEWRKYIKLGNPGSNDFTVTAPGRFSGPDKGTYDQINQYIYGKTEGSKTVPTEVKVKDPKTQQTGTFKGTAEEAKKAGFEVLQ